MTDLIQKQPPPPALSSQAIEHILESLRKIEAGSINSNDMMCRMLLIEGSPAWKSKGITSLLKDAEVQIGNSDAEFSVDKSIYLHIAKKALAEDLEGSSVGLMNAQDALEKAFALASRTLIGADRAKLESMLPETIPQLTSE